MGVPAIFGGQKHQYLCFYLCYSTELYLIAFLGEVFSHLPDSGDCLSSGPGEPSVLQVSGFPGLGEF